MNYYVTLPSNGADLSTEEARINNTQTDFTINLNKPIEFNVQYEVALAEIWYSLNWRVFVTNIKIFHDGKVLIDSDIEYSEGMKLNHVFKKIRNAIELEINKVDGEKIVEEIHEMHTEAIKQKRIVLDDEEEEEVDENHIFHNADKINIIRLLGLIKFEEGKRSNKILNIFIPDGLRLELTGFLPSLLTQWQPIKLETNNNNDDRVFNIFSKQNIKNNQEFLSIDGSDLISYRFLLMSDHLRVIKELYLYTDIIDYQYVGSQMRKLLRVITVNKNVDTNNHMSFSDLHYLPVNMNRLDSIRLKLADDQGQPIRFGDERSRVIYTLHFRPINKTNY
jgi:hypothetical protein